MQVSYCARFILSKYGCTHWLDELYFYINMSKKKMSTQLKVNWKCSYSLTLATLNHPSFPCSSHHHIRNTVLSSWLLQILPHWHLYPLPPQTSVSSELLPIPSHAAPCQATYHLQSAPLHLQSLTQSSPPPPPHPPVTIWPACFTLSQLNPWSTFAVNLTLPQSELKSYGDWTLSTSPLFTSLSVTHPL